MHRTPEGTDHVSNGEAALVQELVDTQSEHDINVIERKLTVLKRLRQQ